MSKHVFWENKKNISVCRLLKYLHRVLCFNMARLKLSLPVFRDTPLRVISWALSFEVITYKLHATLWKYASKTLLMSFFWHFITPN